MDRKRVKEQVKAIMESKTLTQAYMKTHNCSENTAKKHAYEMMKNPEIVAEIDKQLSLVKAVDVNKQSLVKLLTLVVMSWQNGTEKTADFLRAIELLSRLVPEFSDKHTIEHYQNMTDDQINSELSERLKKLGLS